MPASRLLCLPLLLWFAASSILSAQLVRQSATSLNLPASLPSATGYTTQNALGTLTFNRPIDVATFPGVTNRLLVVERGDTGAGRAATLQLVNLDGATPTKSLFLDLSAALSALGASTSLSTGDENGFLSAAVHPDYNQNGYVYVFYSCAIASEPHQRVARFTAAGTPGNYNAATALNPASHLALITQRDQAGNHNGGDLAFGPDGYLYISVGDEGGANDEYDNARRIAKDFFGAILRIDVDNRPTSLAPNPHTESSNRSGSSIHAGTYRIPADNPFVALGSGAGTATYNGFSSPRSAVRTEIYAPGFRNPWRMSFDMPTGRLFVADVGQGAREEVSIVTNGFNGGWSWREGFIAFTSGPAGASNPPAGAVINSPIYDYGRSGSFGGSSVTGGVVYRGSRLTELYEAYIFCDFNSGNLWAIRPGAPGGAWSATRLGGDNDISGFGIDPRDGEPLLCDLRDGQVKRIVRSGNTGTPPPALLSQTEAFSSLSTLTPQPGVVPYDVNVPFWSDYAAKRRWFAIRNSTDTVGFSAEGNWTLPAGMVWVKHFDIETRRGDPTTRRKLETRFLVKTATDIYGLSYRWREDGSEADLVAEEGANFTFDVESNGQTKPQTWRFPSRSECRTCHTRDAGFALSFNTHQLNHPQQYGEVTKNLISHLSEAGYFSAPVASVHTLPAHVAASNSSQSLEARVRSYLAVNCAQCHQPGGAALGNWDARPSTPTDLAGLIRGALINPGGDPANRVVVPDDPGHSMLLGRLTGEDGPRMPPLATNEVDPDAVALLTAWITQELPQRQSFPEWQVVHFGSSGSAEAQPAADPDADGSSNRLEFLQKSSPVLPTPALAPDLDFPSLGSVTLAFQQPANRAALIETSTDLQTWSLWDVEGNTPSYPGLDTSRTLSGPAIGAARYFRLRLHER